MCLYVHDTISIRFHKEIAADLLWVRGMGERMGVSIIFTDSVQPLNVSYQQLKTRQQAPNKVLHAEPHITKPRLS